MATVLRSHPPCFMPNPPNYVYDARASARLAAQTHAVVPGLACGPERAHGQRVIGVFAFQGRHAVKVTMIDNERFLAERLDGPPQAPLAQAAPGAERNRHQAAATGPLSRLQAVLRDVLRGLLSRFPGARPQPGGDAWILRGEDHDAMDSFAYAQSLRQWQRCAQLQLDTQREAPESPALLHLPKAVQARIASYLPKEPGLYATSVAMACSANAARAQAEGVSTLSGLNSVIRQWVEAPSDQIARAATLSPAERADVAEILVSRIPALPPSQRSQAATSLLRALDAPLIETGQAAGVLLALVETMEPAGLWHSSAFDWPETLLCQAIGKLPAASRVAPYLALLERPGGGREEIVAALMPSADWLGPHPPVHPSQQREVIQAISRWAFSNGSPQREDIADMVLALPRSVTVSPGTEQGTARDVSTMAFKSMVLTELLQLTSHRFGKQQTGRVARWDRLFEEVKDWPTIYATPVIAALGTAVKHLVKPQRAQRLAAVQSWAGTAPLSPEQRLAVQIAAFRWRGRDKRALQWQQLWSAWLDLGPERDISVGLKIVALFARRPDSAEWANELLRRIGALPAEQRAALLAGVPQALYRAATEPILAGEVEQLAASGHPEPMVRWLEHYQHDETMLEPMLAAFARLPVAAKIACVLWVDPDTTLPKPLIETALNALATQSVDPEIAVSLAAIVAGQFVRRYKRGEPIDSEQLTRMAALADSIMQMDEARHDAQLMANMAQLGNVLGLRTRGSAELFPMLARTFSQSAWRAIGGGQTEPHMRRAALEALFSKFCDPGAVELAPQTFDDALAVAATLPPADRIDMLVELAHLERRLHGNHERRAFDGRRQALWRAIAALPPRHLARGLALAAPWFVPVPGFTEPCPAQLAQAAREFEARWRTLPAEDRDALFPCELQPSTASAPMTMSMRRA